MLSVVQSGCDVLRPADERQASATPSEYCPLNSLQGLTRILCDGLLLVQNAGQSVIIS